MPDLKFGITFFLDQQDFGLAAQLEEWGYDSAWVSEHIFFHGPSFDALSALAFAAARTERILLGTAVNLLPLRPAAVVAKQAASVDIMSGGRLVLGVGVGGEYPPEFEACGVPVSERGARTDEAIRVLRRLWTGEEVSFEGRFTRLNAVRLQPPPVQEGGPPIWVAGRSDAAIRRAGRLGDGFMPYLYSPQQYRDGLAKVREGCERAGRDPARVVPALYQFVCLRDSYEEAVRDAAAGLQRTYQQPFERVVERYVVMGNADQCARRLAEYAEAGVEHFVLVPIVSGSDEFLDHAGRYAHEIMPAVRGNSAA